MFTKHILILCSAMLLLSLMVHTTPAFGDDWWTPRTVPTDFYNYQDDWVGEEGQGGGDGDWCNPDNWAKHRPPDPNTTAEIQPMPLGPNILGNCAATCSRLEVQPWSWGGAGNIDCNIGPNAGLVDCGVVLSICGRTDFDSSTQGHGILNVYGGTMFTPATSAYWGDANGLRIGGGFSRIAACYGILNQFGGLISVPRIALYNGVANLYGGVLEDTHDGSQDFIISNRYARTKINLAGGTLLLEGDRATEIAPYIADGRIRAYDNIGNCSVTVNYSATTGYTTVTAGPVADFTGDCVVDLADLMVLSQEWLTAGVKADIYPEGNPDELVNFGDFAIFADEYYEPRPGQSGISYSVAPCVEMGGASQQGTPRIASATTTQTRFTVTVEGQYIHFEDMMVANCCTPLSNLWLEMTTNDNLITIYEHEDPPQYPCTCICNFPVDANSGPFETGTYTLDVYEDYGNFIGSTMFTIE